MRFQIFKCMRFYGMKLYRKCMQFFKIRGLVWGKTWTADGL